MGRFSAFEDPALQGRIERSRRAEKDLQERVQARIDQVEKEGRWLRSDPLYQPLSSLLRKVRDELREAEQELSQRRSTSFLKKAA